jgi:predicted phosphodiesterase
VRIWLLSDLHIELTRGWDLPAAGARPDYDVLVLAGDIITRTATFRRMHAGGPSNAPPASC